VASAAAGIADAEAKKRAKIMELRAMMQVQFDKTDGKRKAGSTFVKFVLQLGENGERVEAREADSGQVPIGQNQLELLLIRTPVSHPVRATWSKYLGAGASRWKPTLQQQSDGGWTSSHDDWPADLRVVDRSTFTV
jgi:hypothetical protein